LAWDHRSWRSGQTNQTWHDRQKFMWKHANPIGQKSRWVGPLVVTLIFEQFEQDLMLHVRRQRSPQLCFAQSWASPSTKSYDAHKVGLKIRTWTLVS
jgi:hypothetical protein